MHYTLVLAVHKDGPMLSATLNVLHHLENSNLSVTRFSKPRDVVQLRIGRGSYSQF